jgi:hypothetical protein
MKKLSLISLMAILILAITLTGCGGGSGGSSPTYTVTYNGNGNTGGVAPASTKYKQGQTVTVSGNTGNLLNIDGSTTAYGFAGWNTQADGNGTNYEAGATFIIGDSNVTLYAKWVPYVLRDTGPAGGLIFYDKGNYSDGWRYLEAAPSDQSTGLPFAIGLYTTWPAGASGTAVGTGQENTAIIVDACGAGSYAAKICDDLVIGGYDDWFLPSKDEINNMFWELKSLGVGNFTNDDYWSSSECANILDPLDFSLAVVQKFNVSGSQSWDSKANSHRVRMARAF